jgi:hypothetical protein
MHAIIFFYADPWYVNVWEHAGFGAKLIASTPYCLHSKAESLDWLYNDSGCHIMSKEVRDYSQAFGFCIEV